MEVKYCPFCGKEVTVSYKFNLMENLHGIECVDCGKWFLKKSEQGTLNV